MNQNELLLKKVYEIIDKTNSIDEVYNYLLNHFTIEDRLCFDGKFDQVQYVVKYIKYNKLEDRIRYEQPYTIADDSFDRFGY